MAAESFESDEAVDLLFRSGNRSMLSRAQGQGRPQRFLRTSIMLCVIGQYTLAMSSVTVAGSSKSDYPLGRISGFGLDS